jgi:hypothetical protein
MKIPYVWQSSKSKFSISVRKTRHVLLSGSSNGASTIIHVELYSKYEVLQGGSNMTGTDCV